MKMTTKIPPKIRLSFLTLLFVSAIPMISEALEVKFCVPSCAAPVAGGTRTFGPGTPSTVSGVTTTRISIPSFNLPTTGTARFTIAGTVTSQQSGTLQKITFNPTSVATTAAAGCNTTATNPCRLEIMATSHFNDFPLRKPTGGYPSGVFMAGFFTGTEPAHRFPPDPNGDTISLTGEASGLKESAAGSPALIIESDALNKAVINATPTGGPGDTPVSLPSSCTGNAACKFIATAGLKSFNTQLTETVQQKCDPGQTTCRTRLRTKVNIEIKRAGNRVNLPAQWATVDPPPPGPPLPTQENPLTLLSKETLPPFENLNINALRVFSKIKTFELDGGFTLDEGNGIAPDKEETYLRIGSFAISIPPAKFKRLLNGRLFSFIGKLDNRDVTAMIARGSNPSKWTFIIIVNGTDVGPLLPAGQVPVDLAVGSDTGSDLVTACFSKGCVPLRPRP
jgi:hypothetical protein